MTKGISVSLDVEGFHRWQDAPDEVKFLRNYHRHLFKINVTMSIDEDRGVEFFTLVKEIRSIIDEWISKSDYPMLDDFSWEDFYLETGEGFDEDMLVIGSCESFAEWILSRLEDTHEDCFIEVSVSEDGENAGIANND